MVKEYENMHTFYLGTVFGLCQTVGAAGLLAANYVVSEGLHGSVSILILISKGLLTKTNSVKKTYTNWLKHRFILQYHMYVYIMITDNKGK